MYKILYKYLDNDKNTLEMKRKFIENIINEIEIIDIQTKDENGNTILHYLCENKMHESIKLLIETLKLKSGHFQNNSYTGRTELYQLCYKKMHETIALITSNFVDGDCWKPEHFQNKSDAGQTELSWLCYHIMHPTIALISRNFIDSANEDKVFDNEQSTFWKPEHFQNKNICKQTELYWLCFNKMRKTITLITKNFVNGANENKVFGNVARTFWKPEHCNFNMERNYMERINAFVVEKKVEPVVEKKEEYVVVENKKEYNIFEEFKKYTNILKSINNKNNKFEIVITLRPKQ